MLENISIEEKALNVHNTIDKAKNIMLVLSMNQLEISDMIGSKIYNIGILRCIIENMSILVNQLKTCINECNDIYTEMLGNKSIQEQYGFNDKKIQEDSISFNNVTSKFIDDIESLINLTNEFIKINSGEG